MFFNIGSRTDETCLGHFLTLLCPYSIFTDLLSRDLLYLNRVTNYTLLSQLVKGFDWPILTKFQSLSGFDFFRCLFHHLKLQEYTTIQNLCKGFCVKCCVKILILILFLSITIMRIGNNLEFTPGTIIF